MPPACLWRLTRVALERMHKASQSPLVIDGKYDTKGSAPNRSHRKTPQPWHGRRTGARVKVARPSVRVGALQGWTAPISGASLRQIMGPSQLPRPTLPPPCPPQTWAAHSAAAMSVAVPRWLPPLSTSPSVVPPMHRLAQLRRTGLLHLQAASLSRAWRSRCLLKQTTYFATALRSGVLSPALCAGRCWRGL